MQNRETISSLQLLVILVSNVLGLGILTLPREVTDACGTPDAWMSLLLVGVVVCIPVAILGKLSSVFPQTHFLDDCQLLVGQFGKWVIGWYLILYYLMIISMELRGLGMLVGQYLLDRTPIEIVILIPLFASVYVVTGGFGPIVRINQMFFPVVVGMFILSLLMAFQNVEIKNLQPMFSKGFQPVLKGVPAAAFSLLGVEIIWYFSNSLKKKQCACGGTCRCIVHYLYLCHAGFPGNRRIPHRDSQDPCLANSGDDQGG
ncbi:spore germination protein (amino acid permease) [Effusibacillus lacus]|nr:GerAB/ArcD/ProY family transporter [Effusibacillus lacus]TCS71634.1 spore germination protein (amino acid permease) [Effusibacillus lacus]